MLRFHWIWENRFDLILSVVVCKRKYEIVLLFLKWRYLFSEIRNKYSWPHVIIIQHKRHSNQQSNSIPRLGPVGISNAPEIPDILIPWDLLSYLLWESEFMMSKLGFFICVPGGCNMRPRWLDLLITGSSMPHFKGKESPRHATSEN